MKPDWSHLAKPAVIRPLPTAIQEATENTHALVAKKLAALEAPSTPNLREHWAKRAKRAKQQRTAGKRLAAKALPSPRALLFVTLTRVAPRRLDDDNNVSALKSYRDGVADFLRIDDRSPLVCWSYEQRKGPASVEVHITENPF